MKDIILDVLKHTANTGFFECVKITGNANETFVQAANGEPTIVLNATTKKPELEFDGVFGFGNLTYLKGLSNFEPFRKKDTELKIVKKTRDGKEVPEVIEYSSSDGAKATYRLMHESTIPPMPQFKGTEWDIEFTPKKEKIDEFAQLAGLHAEMEDRFIIKTVNGNLVFFIGEEGSSSHKAQFIFEKDVVGTLEVALKWPIQEVLQTLRLSQNSQSTLKITKKGLICISIDSGLADYDFYIVARQG